MKAQTWVLNNHFNGFPKDEDLQLKEEDLPTLNEGDVLFEAVCLTVDPYMRIFSGGWDLGSVMQGEQVARVVTSRHAGYIPGQLYLGGLGWRTHTVVAIEEPNAPSLKLLPDLGNLPASLTLGTLGMTGVTAYLALLDVGQPQAGDVVLVNAAAGAVGSLVGQIAKIKGCTVIGSAGTDAKVAWLKEVGFDHAFNYKTLNFSDELAKLAPQGLNIFFDLVGGDTSCTIIKKHMKQGGRVVVVGAISHSNETGDMQGPVLFESILFGRLRIQGFVIFDQPAEKWVQAQTELKQWISEGKVQYREHVTEGFADMRTAFYGLFRGDNIGKAIVTV